MNQIKKPETSGKPKKKIGYKEKKVMKHLEETCALVGNLNHNDMKVIRLLREKEKSQKEDQIEKERYDEK